MSNGDVTKQILAGSSQGLKTYTFDEEHDDNLPAQWWFQQAIEGLVLFVVFYTQACRWSRCLACNLPSKCSKHHVDFRSIEKQVKYLFWLKKVEEQTKRIKKIIISNNGSVLDQDTFSSTALIYLISKINTYLPKVKIVSLETRPEYIEHEELAMIKRTLEEGQTTTELELAIGFEAFSDQVRNDQLLKGLSLEVFEKAVELIAPFGYNLKCYLMQKPVPGMSNQDAIDDVRQAFEYFGKLRKKYPDVPINIHLNPTYVASGTELEKAYKRGEFTPPILSDVIKALQFADGKDLSVYVGLFDEGLAVEGGSIIRPGDEPLIEKIETFNRQQNFAVLS